MKDVKRAMKFLKKALRNNDEKLGKLYTPQEIAYMQLQLETMEAGRQAEHENRRRTKGFKNS